jgi:hypothetical protein
MVVFALVFRRRPLIGGVGITIMVLCILVAALFGARSGHVAAIWPRTMTWSHAPAIPGPSIAPDVSGISHGLPQLEGELPPVVVQEPVIVKSIPKKKHIQETRLALREAREEALAHRQAMASGDETAMLMLSEQAPSASVEFRRSGKSRPGFLRRILGGSWCKTSCGAPRCLLSSLLTAAVIAAFLGVGYVFLDASTRGHFTWPLRIAAVAAFAAIYVAMSALR